MFRYGALMWSLGKVINSPEVVRVYVGSFWDDIKRDSENYSLIIAEHQDLLNDLRDLPRNAAVRKINEIVKRARLAKVHAYIVGHLKSQMPSVFGKSSKQQELIDNLDQEFLKIMKQYHLPVGDFPDIDRFRASLKNFNFSDFPKPNPKMVTNMDEVLATDLPKLMHLFPQGNETLPEHMKNPFEQGTGNIFVTSENSPDPWKWDNVEKSRFMVDFKKLNPVDGKVSGAAVKPLLQKSDLPNSDLQVIWNLADITKDGYLDSDEFCLALHLIQVKNAGIDLPKQLPESLMPPKGKI
jgi:hypothetical protein